MNIEQIYTGCLAQGAYYITSNDEAAIIDPLREIKPYLQRLKKDNVQLKYIFETHFHADFVSGHIDLSKATGAPIFYGPGAECGFDCKSAADGQEFKLGDTTIIALHTPGHTMESTVYLLRDNTGKDHCIFSGDTLFAESVGRTDFATGSFSDIVSSIKDKLFLLPDDKVVFPGHGESTSIAHEKKYNPYCQ